MLKLRRKDFSTMSWKVADPFYYFTFTILALKWIEYKRKAYEWKKSLIADELRLSISYNINQVSYPIKKKVGDDLQTNDWLIQVEKDIEKKFLQLNTEYVTIVNAQNKLVRQKVTVISYFTMRKQCMSQLL